MTGGLWSKKDQRVTTSQRGSSPGHEEKSQTFRVMKRVKYRHAAIIYPQHETSERMTVLKIAKFKSGRLRRTLERIIFC